MESRRPSSGYPAITIDEVVHSQSRRPLSHSAGNSAYPTVASTDIYHDHKSLPTPIENTHSRYSPSVPLHQPQPIIHPPPLILPSQNFALQTPCASTLERRKTINRKRRLERHDTHFIVESPQYQQYRLRQIGHDSPDDQKWPEDLEMAFLDAQVDIPKMGRRKFSYKGKPHGRNELISEYLWIAHIKSLPPGAKPDKTKSRTRKQVSSHIQVLKGYMRQHPAYDQLFKTGNSTRNQFQDSFKDDPCLKALAKGELPPWRRQFYYHESRSEPSPPPPLKDVSLASPDNFSLWISRPTTDLEAKYDPKNADYPHDSVHNAWHRFTDFDPRPRPRESLETLRDWRVKFPRLAQLMAAGDLNCDVIHMDLTLLLPDSSLPKLSSLCASFDLFIPGKDMAGVTWQSLTLLDNKQLKYRSDPESHSPHITNRLESFPDGRGEYGTYMRVPFPVTRWAHMIQSLMTVQQEYEDGLRSGLPQETLTSARDYLEQITMYQEIFSQPSGADQERRAVILWTFQKASRGIDGARPLADTTWRQLDFPPPRRTVMSPPTYSQQVTSSINENLWAPPPQLTLEIPHLLDALDQGLHTPPNSGVTATATLQSPFIPGYPGYSAPGATGGHTGVSSDPHHATAPPSHNSAPSTQQRHLSYMSTDTTDSETTLVEQNPMDSFLRGSNGSYADHHAHHHHHHHHVATSTAGGVPWLPPPIESFAADHGWSYHAHVPVSTSAVAPPSLPPPQTTWPDDPADLGKQAWHADANGFVTAGHDGHLGHIAGLK